jgi:hypothetical protein
MDKTGSRLSFSQSFLFQVKEENGEWAIINTTNDNPLVSTNIEKYNRNIL